MRTYYVFVKWSPTGFHLTATLCSQGPKGYTGVSQVLARNQAQAVVEGVRVFGGLPEPIKDGSRELQARFV